jgi:uncharacterized membrane protein YheB (UPF0754 family)
MRTVAAFLSLFAVSTFVDGFSTTAPKTWQPITRSRSCDPTSCARRHSPLFYVVNQHRYASSPSRLSYPRTHTRFDTALPQGPLVITTLSLLQRAVAKFQSRPGTYLLIPVVAAGVGWLTNWLAVQMIFYPIQYWGLPIYRRPEIPLGFVGWQGIVPCKTRKMSETMVHMVTSQLLSVSEAFERLDPKQVAALLAPEMAGTVQELLNDALPRWTAGIVGRCSGVVQYCTRHLLVDLTKGIQQNIDSVLSLQDCVVAQMLQDRTRLGILFRKCGQKELDFLVNSGLWFGFLLGLMQMVVALLWENPWSLSIGGGIVGLATNWLALKWIFEPINEVSLGPLKLQGMFLRRQPEVAKEFSNFFANNILTAEQLWKSVLSNPNTKPAFASLVSSHFMSGWHKLTRGISSLDPTTLNRLTETTLSKLPQHVPVLYKYMDKTLELETTLHDRMLKMSSRQFERVLHPIFEEDELTLIVAGAVLGFAAGLVQQGLETGAISLPLIRDAIVAFAKNPRQGTLDLSRRTRSTLQSRLRIMAALFPLLGKPKDEGDAAGDSTETTS